MILVDSNILMYAGGAAHPYKTPSIAFLETVATGDVEACVDAEVLQEILHRYRAIRRWADGRLVYDLSRRLFPLVIPITADILDRARSLLDEHDDLVARDALHAAVVVHEKLDAICSYDDDFDEIEGLRRIEPSD